MEEKPLSVYTIWVKRYGDVLALDHLDLEIKRGEIYGLWGQTGSGEDHGHQLPSGSPWI